jgi:hypothetical protein
MAIPLWEAGDIIPQAKGNFCRVGESILRQNIKSVDGFTIHCHQTGKLKQRRTVGYGRLGNYYGAGASGINWRENQFDVELKSLNPDRNECFNNRHLP